MTEPLIFSHGATAAVFDGVAAAWVAFEGVMSVRQRWRAGHLNLRDPTSLVLIACLGGAVYAAIRIGRDGGVLWPGGRQWPVIAGIALIVTGTGLRAWSIATLGRFFQYQIEIQAGHQVVTTGPYRYVRHPSYTGLALALIGFALASGDVLSLPAVPRARRPRAGGPHPGRGAAAEAGAGRRVRALRGAAQAAHPRRVVTARRG